ncbi:MAG: hypothetical protein IPJ49_24445 [Candidatus Obscuribacter sp.]|jgi:Spy/CpxP family protein refolding chaperone|nr:hypothetical protein [Candidatus Obscuribacter sp.]
MKVQHILAVLATTFSVAPVLAQSAPLDNVSPMDNATPIIAQESGKPSFVAQTEGRKPHFIPLTDDQKAKLGTLRDQYILSTANKKAELMVASRQLKETLHATTVDKSAALTLQGKINNLKADLSTARLNMMLASSDVFTAEQREQMQKMHRMHGWGHKGHGGKGKGECGGPRGGGMRGKAFGPGPEGPGGPGAGPSLSAIDLDDPLG